MADFYCYVVNGVIERYNIQKPKAHGNTAYGANVTDAELAADGYFPIVGEPPEYDSATQRLEGPTYTVGDGVVTRSYQVVAYVPPVPRSLTRRKALQQLLIEGYTQADIEAMIPQLPVSELEKNLALIEFRESLEFERYRPLTVMMAALMGKDETWLDRVFVDGDKLP